LGIATFVVVGALFATGSEKEGADLLRDYDGAAVVMRTLKEMSGWFWVVAIMAFAAGSGKQGQATRPTNRGATVLDRVDAYTAEAVLTLLCVLFCQGVFGLGGQDWVERHRVGGRLL